MQLSFRDPDGFVFRHGNRILRCVYPRAAGDVRCFLSSAAATEWMSCGTLPSAKVLTGEVVADLPSELRDAAPAGSLFVEHNPIPFGNYPYEWAPGMLHSAAALTLRLAQSATTQGFGLKDATPYNLMFDGPKPVFIDALSFECRDPLDILWRPYAQFVQTFIYPLLAVRYFGLRLDEILLPHRDGLPPERILALCPTWRLLLPPFLGSVTIPGILSHKDDAPADGYRPRRAKDATEARFLLDRLFARANRQLRGVSVPANRNAASRYSNSGHRYAPAEMAAKEQVVEQTLACCQPCNVLDIGCNTGQFSRIAARHAVRVVAIDRDPAAVGALWKTACESNLNILPLVVDLARPPGACGWDNREFPSFLDRARGKFDCLLMLALLHHLLVSERVPLDRIFQLASELTTQHAIVEYVDPADAQFRRIARGRDILHRDLNHQAFEAAARRRFCIAASRQVTPTRWIYWLRKGRD